jgi:hypothetical protein
MIILYFYHPILIFTVSVIYCRLLIIYTNLYLANIHKCNLNGIRWNTCSFHVLIRRLQLAWWWPFNGSKPVARCTSVSKYILCCVWQSIVTWFMYTQWDGSNYYKISRYFHFNLISVLVLWHFLSINPKCLIFLPAAMFKYAASYYEKYDQPVCIQICKLTAV